MQQSLVAVPLTDSSLWCAVVVTMQNAGSVNTPESHEGGGGVTGPAGVVNSARPGVIAPLEVGGVSGRSRRDSCGQLLEEPSVRLNTGYGMAAAVAAAAASGSRLDHDDDCEESRSAQACF